MASSGDVLDWAALGGRDDIALVLLKTECIIRQQEAFDVTLCRAAEEGFVDIVRFLKQRYPTFYTIALPARRKALELAILKGRTSLLESHFSEADNTDDSLPQNGISIAALGGHNDTIDLLHSHGLDINLEGPYGAPLRAACILGYEATARHLIGLGADVTASGRFGSALQAAAVTGNEALVKYLLDRGAVAGAYNGIHQAAQALKAAALHGNYRVAEVLLKSGVYLHRDAFDAASGAGNEAILQLFLDRGYKPQRSLPIGHMCTYPAPTPRPELLRDNSPTRHYSREMNSRSVRGSWGERASTTDSSTIARNILEDPYTGDVEGVFPHQSYSDLPPDKEKGDRICSELCGAAANGHAHIVELLLSRLEHMGFDKSGVGAAFKEACKRGKEVVVRMLWFDQLSIPFLEEAIEAAALHGHMHLILMLSQQEGALKQTSVLKKILLAGAKGGHWRVFTWSESLLLQQSSHFSLHDSYREALMLSVNNPEPSILQAILNTGLEFNHEQLDHILTRMAETGSQAIVQAFVEHHHPVGKILADWEFTIYIRRAVRSSNHSALSFLLKKFLGNPNTSIETDTVIHAVAMGDVRIVSLLLDALNPKMSGLRLLLNKCLQVAAENGHFEVAQSLISKGAEVNSVTHPLRWIAPGMFIQMGETREDESQNITALKAAVLGFKRFLFPKNERTSWSQFKSISSETEADTAALQRQRKTLFALLEWEADPNLHCTNRTDTVIETKSPPPAPTNLRRRAPSRFKRSRRVAAEMERIESQLSLINIAAAYCSPDVVGALLAAGADLDLNLPIMENPIIMAASRENQGGAVLAILLKFGARLDEADHPREGNFRHPLGSSQTRFRLSESLSAEAFSHTMSLFQPECLFSWTSTARALKTGPGAAARILLENSPALQASDSDYSYLLQMACSVGDLGFVQLLISRGANINHNEHHYGTPLQAACRFGHLDIVRLLVEKGAEIDQIGGKYQTAIRAAVEGGHSVVVQYLVHEGCDVNLEPKSLSPKDMKDQSPIALLALRAQKSETWKHLITAGMEIQNVTHDGFHIALELCRRGWNSAVEQLLLQGLDSNMISRKSLHRPHVRFNETTPLEIACSKGNNDLVQILIDHGADLEERGETGWTPLIVAAREGNSSIVTQLLKAGADANGSSSSQHFKTTPLARAVYNGHVGIFEELLRYGAMPKEPSSFQNLLEIACSGKEHTMVGNILNLIHDQPEKKLICNQSLPAAVAARSFPAVRLLLEGGGSSNLDLLRQACARGHLDIFELLHTPSIDINSDESGSLRDEEDIEQNGVLHNMGIPLLHIAEGPLLHIAAYYANPAVLDCLIRKGADLDLNSSKFGLPLAAALKGLLIPHLRSKSMHDEYERQKGPCFGKLIRCQRIIDSLLAATVSLGAQMKKRSLRDVLLVAAYLGSQSLLDTLFQQIDGRDRTAEYKFDDQSRTAQHKNHTEAFESLKERADGVGNYIPNLGFVLQSVLEHDVVEDSEQRLIIKDAKFPMIIEDTRRLLIERADFTAYNDKYVSGLKDFMKRNNSVYEQKSSADTQQIRRTLTQILEEEWVWVDGHKNS